MRVGMRTDVVSIVFSGHLKHFAERLGARWAICNKRMAVRHDSDCNATRSRIYGGGGGSSKIAEAASQPKSCSLFGVPYLLRPALAAIPLPHVHKCIPVLLWLHLFEQVP